MEYNYNTIEKKWQQSWQTNGIYSVNNESSKPKCYVLDMFPYPSGAGLHVGHPLGYIASDIYARFKRLKGFNVLHPMGYDAFGLPAEQYAIEHGVHPAKSTDENIGRFRNQLDKMGLCYDWEREVNTSKPNYYKWTQWIFLQLFNSFYNRATNKAEPIANLTKHFEEKGNDGMTCPNNDSLCFTAQDWSGFDEKQQHDVLMQYRLAYCGTGEVNWCEALGTVLANDEVVNGVSERGGHPVTKKKLRQWYLRITEYADRLLEGLQRVDFSEAMKEMQSNWIGKSQGAEITFDIESESGENRKLTVYTTRPDTIFGVDFIVIAPELDWIKNITSNGRALEVETYLNYVKSRSDRERQAEKKISGCFTGAFAINPFNGQKIPIWISEYVLAGYGTGAIMAVPCGDDRDFRFAKHFKLPITNIIGDAFNGQEANPTKDALLHNSSFLNGVPMRQAMEIVLAELEIRGVGKRKVQFRMRDASFSRQRYWGEPFPIKWIDGMAKPLPESELPLLLPTVESYGPGKDGEGPLSNIPEWVSNGFETNTMPGYAGSSWYFLRYMDPKNEGVFCGRKASDYWEQVDLYIGGNEHAVGHLLYSRMWTKALYDLGHIGFDEPFKRLINQGMITGNSRFVFRISGTNTLVSADLMSAPDFSNNVYDRLHVDISLVNDSLELDLERFKAYKNGEFQNAEFITKNGKYITGAEVEKMSKSKLNTISPDDLIEKYGADTFRMYEMFLGPIEQSKPWDTKGIEGVHRFLKKLWRLFYDEQKGKVWNEEKAIPEELKILHKTIKKIADDSERFSFNTAVSAFMVCTNELTDIKCNKKSVLEQLLIILSPYAPHITEELWHLLGNQQTIFDSPFPTFDPSYLVEESKEYPISINGKVRANISISLQATEEEATSIAISNDTVKKWIEGKSPKKIVFVKGKMINIVI